MKKIKTHTLGCKVNAYETEAILESFILNGFQFASSFNDADVILLNTCAVTQNASSKSIKYVRRFVKMYPESFLIVMGCFSQLESDMVLKAGAKIVVGTRGRSKIFNLYKNYTEPVIFILDPFKENYESLLTLRSDRTRAYVKIEDGCNEFCSFCIIPFLRGTVKSRDKNEIINEIKYLNKTGTKEIVLTGINTGAYGKDLKNTSFADLLELICLNPEIDVKIRISSLEVVEVSSKLLSVLSRFKSRFCPHFHLPIQSGSDGVLKKMQRKYTTSDYLEIVKKLRLIWPQVNITTDVLTGFPGETDDEFYEGVNFFKEIGFGEMHVFPFSKRKFTKAYTFKDAFFSQREERKQFLLKLNNQLASRYREQFFGKVLLVLVESVFKGYAKGHAENYLEVTFKYRGKPNTFVYVKITNPMYPVAKGEIYEI